MARPKLRNHTTVSVNKRDLNAARRALNKPARVGLPDREMTNSTVVAESLQVAARVHSDEWSKRTLKDITIHANRFAMVAAQWVALQMVVELVNRGVHPAAGIEVEVVEERGTLIIRADTMDGEVDIPAPRLMVQGGKLTIGTPRGSIAHPDTQLAGVSTILLAKEGEA